MYINDMNQVKDAVLKEILAKVIIKGCENISESDASKAIACNVLDGLGINIRRLESLVGNEASEEHNIVIKSIVNTVDHLSSKVLRTLNGENIPDDSVHQTIISAMEAEDTPNVLADTINEILNNAVSSMQTDIKTASKMVLQLIKENQDAEKKDKETELEDFDNPDMEKQNEEDGDNKEENTEDDTEDKGDGDGNPFDNPGSDDGDNKDDESKDNNEEDKEPQKDEPKEEEKDKDESGDEGAGDENPFESISNRKLDVIIKNWNNGYDIRAFEGLTYGDIANFSNFCANGHVGGALKDAYSKMDGMESDEFKHNVEKFKTVSRAYGEVTVSTLLTLGKLGIKGNNNCIKYPKSYLD
jgi:hypothetical protein|nr:MAG TPA: hypothetical protein [Caudoviricetes sp.]